MVGGTKMPMWQMHITPSLWLLELEPEGGGGGGWHKMPMWQMHITPSLWLLKCSGQGGERWNLC